MLGSGLVLGIALGLGSGLSCVTREFVTKRVGPTVTCFPTFEFNTVDCIVSARGVHTISLNTGLIQQ